MQVFPYSHIPIFLTGQNGMGLALLPKKQRPEKNKTERSSKA
jgi:hypothetical protein